MKFSEYKFEWSLLCGALLIALISIVLDIRTISDTTWFARSGSILVLFAAIVEYRLSSFIFDDINNAAVKNAIKDAVISTFDDNKLIQAVTSIKPKPPKSRAALAITSHVLIINGTFIWGYGDFIVK